MLITILIPKREYLLVTNKIVFLTFKIDKMSMKKVFSYESMS